MTSIEWTEATWNPTTGCDRVSPGCDHCYALTLAARLKKMGQSKYQNDGDPATSGPGFALTIHPDTLDLPLRRRKPTTYFVNSMSDLFHPDVPESFIRSVWAVMADTPRHTYQILTKRPQWMAYLANDRTATPAEVDDGCELGEVPGLQYDHPLPNVWLGTSIENDRYSWRANHLRVTPAAVRFLSLEPLLGPLPSLNLDGIDWVIVGGESGPGARPIHPDWARDIRDRCIAAGIPFFFKQWGEYRPFLTSSDEERTPMAWLSVDGRLRSEDEALGEPGTDWIGVHRLGKKRAGRELDGRTWDQTPERTCA